MAAILETLGAGNISLAVDVSVPVVGIEHAKLDSNTRLTAPHIVLYGLPLLLILVFSRPFFTSLVRSRNRQKLLPSPRGLPYIGHVPEMDANFPATKVADWAKTFQPIFKTVAVGVKLVWVSDRAVQHDLFVHRAAKYSSRPPLPSTPGSSTLSHYLPLMALGPVWKRHRTFVTSALSVIHNARYHGYLEADGPWFQQRLLDSPADFYDLISDVTGRISARMAYGSPASFKEHSINAHAFIGQISLSGPATMRFPFMMSWPEWLVPSKKTVRLRREREEKLFTSLLASATAQHNEGTLSPCYAQTYLTRKGTERDFGFESEHEAAYAVGMLCTVGIFTIGGLIEAFFLAMARHPEWQTHAQEELDSVIGTRGMASHPDLNKLPVLRAVLKETLRWRPTVPLGVPRYVTEDDVYNGCLIEKGSIVHAVEQIYARNPDTYPHPDLFDPSRWLPSGEYPTSPTTIPNALPTLHGYHQFGVGWRSCPGVAFTEAEAIALCSSVLACFRIELPRDRLGNEYVPDPKPTKCVIGGPQRFMCRVVPRHDEIGALRLEDLAESRKGL